MYRQPNKNHNPISIVSLFLLLTANQSGRSVSVRNMENPTIPPATRTWKNELCGFEKPTPLWVTTPMSSLQPAPNSGEGRKTARYSLSISIRILSPPTLDRIKSGLKIKMHDKIVAAMVANNMSRWRFAGLTK